MAAEGILTALQAALSGLGGGLQGAEQYREMQRRERLAQDELKLRQRGLLAQMGAIPVGDVLPEEEGKIGPMAAKQPPPPPMSPATLGQAIAQRTQAPAGGPGLIAPPAFGTPAAMAPAPERQMSNVERVMGDFRSRPQRTFREGGQRYALPRAPEENTLLSVALQQAMQQDTKAAEDARLAEQARTLAPLIGGDVGKARMVLGGVPTNVLGIDTSTKMERDRGIAEIGLLRAQADAQRAAASLSRAGGKGRRPEEIMDNIANAIAKFSTTRDESTGQLPDMEQVRVFGSTIRSLSGVPIPLEEEFTSPQDQQLIANARANKYSDSQIRQLLTSKKPK